MRDLALAIYCSRCAALPGEPCLTSSRRPTRPHQTRLRPLERAYLRGYQDGYEAGYLHG